MKIIKVIFLLASCLLLLQMLWAQEHIAVSGKVLDRSTHEPVAYATIGVKGRSLGSITNTAGEFVFYVPVKFTLDTLFVSHVGYKTFHARINDLAANPIIYLEELPVVLKEIIVADRKLLAKDVVQAAAEVIPKVFPTEPYIMAGFHRSWEKVEFTDSIMHPGTLIEAAVNIYDPGFGQKKVRREEIFIQEIRRSKMMKFWNYGTGNFLRTLLQENDVRYSRSASFVNLFHGFLNFPNDIRYEWEGMSQFDNESVYVIKATVPNKRGVSAFYRLYISENDLAILRYDLYGMLPELDSVTLKSREWHPVKVEHTYIFKRLGGAPYLNYARIHYHIAKSNRKTAKIERREEYFSELLVNDITIVISENQLESLGVRAKEISFALQAGEYNKKFWENYTIILENPLDKEIVSWFEEQENLQEQFNKQ